MGMQPSARAFWALAFVSALVSALTGCATQQPSPVADPQQMLAGRLSVVVAGEPADGGTPAAAQSLSAAFELRGSPQDGSLDLISPLGSVMARARWSPQQASLSSSRGERRYADLASLTRDMLGESLPVDALFDWLRGRPWPAASSEATASPAPTGFTQLGWRVDLSRFGQSIVVAERQQAPKVMLRARLDTP